MTARLLILTRQFIAGHIEEVGGCDHSVNICCCYEKRIVRQIDEVLVKDFGTRLPWEFYHAEPTHYDRRSGEEPDDEHKRLAPARLWARDGARVYTEIMRSQIEDTMSEIEQPPED